MTEVFISYASEDREIAGALAALMRAAGLSVWWDRDSLHAGDSLPASLSKAARQARVVVVLWSKATAGSEWVPFEVGTNAKVVVVRLDGHVALPEPLRDRLAVEVELGPDGSPAGGLAKLIEAVRRIASPLLIRLRRRLLPFAAGIVGTGFLWWSFSGGDQGFESRLYFIRMEKEPDSTRRMSVRRAYVTRSIRPRTYGQILCRQVFNSETARLVEHWRGTHRDNLVSETSRDKLAYDLYTSHSSTDRRTIVSGADFVFDLELPTREDKNRRGGTLGPRQDKIFLPPPGEYVDQVTIVMESRTLDLEAPFGGGFRLREGQETPEQVDVLKQKSAAVRATLSITWRNVQPNDRLGLYYAW